LHASPPAAELNVGVGDGPADVELGFGESVGFASGVEPGRTMISTMMTMTAIRPSSRSRRRRQYTDGGWGPTGLRSVDMPSG
jgi:hypothetical protein